MTEANRGLWDKHWSVNSLQCWSSSGKRRNPCGIAGSKTVGILRCAQDDIRNCEDAREASAADLR
jgi:hypothetical protein